MKKTEIIQKLNHTSKDEIHYLNQIQDWCCKSKSTDEFINYTRNHTRYYFSPLNNIFLFMIPDINSLSVFDKVLVRDGALSLNLFFLRNPTPKEIKTTLIIHEELSHFIPKEWENNVLLYSYDYLGELQTSNNNLIIIIHPDNYHTPIDYLENEINSIKDSDKYKNIYCIISQGSRTSGHDFISDDLYKKLSIINKLDNVTITNTDELNPMVITKSDILDLNPNLYLYADCFIRWHLLYHGATPINNNKLFSKKEDSIFTLKTANKLKINVTSHKEVQKQNKTLIREIFKEDLRPNMEDYINLCSQGFKDYTIDQIRNDKSN